MSLDLQIGKGDKTLIHLKKPQQNPTHTKTAIVMLLAPENLI